MLMPPSASRLHQAILSKGPRDAILTPCPQENKGPKLKNMTGYKVYHFSEIPEDIISFENYFPSLLEYLVFPGLAHSIKALEPLTQNLFANSYLHKS